MTSSPILQPPNQPQPKSVSLTAQVSNDEAIGSNIQPNVRNAPKSKPGRSRQDNSLPDPASETTTIALIKRILAADKSLNTDQNATNQTGIENVLPPLTSSNDVDIQLYAIIAIIIKDFVNTWYTKITPDHTFVEEVVQIIAHCSRALEQRLRHVDLAELLLNEIPIALQEHVEAYRIATSPLARMPYDNRPSHIYHGLYSHPALSPVPTETDLDASSLQLKNEEAYRQLLVQGTLAVLLPTEDLQNVPLRILVGDIIADIILGQALAGKISEGWFLHDTITKVIATVTKKVQPKASGSELRDDAKGRLERYGLLSSESHVENRHSPKSDQSSLKTWFWRIMQYGYLAVLFLRQFLVGLLHARTLPKRYPLSHALGASPTSLKSSQKQGLAADERTTRPVLGYRVFSFVSTVLNLDNQMPWMASTVSFWRHLLINGPGRIGAPNSILDRFLYHTVCSHLLSPSTIPIVLLNLRTAVFPNNSMGPPAPPPPSLEERIAIKRSAAESILSVMPISFAERYFGTQNQKEMLIQIEKDMLDPFENLYLNKHIIYRILDLVLVKVLPELEEQGIDELFSDRGVNWVPTTDFISVEAKK